MKSSSCRTCFQLIYCMTFCMSSWIHLVRPESQDFCICNKSVVQVRSTALELFANRWMSWTFWFNLFLEFWRYGNNMLLFYILQPTLCSQTAPITSTVGDFLILPVSNAQQTFTLLIIAANLWFDKEAYFPTLLGHFGLYFLFCLQNLS